MGGVECCSAREGNDAPSQASKPRRESRQTEEGRMLEAQHSLAGDVKMRFSHHGFVTTQTEPLEKFYNLGKRRMLGVGSFGTVLRATERSTGSVRAVKAIPKAQLTSLAVFQQEIDLMKVMDHPHIVKLFETYEDRRSVHLVMELCSGGELFDKICEKGSFSEVDSAIITRQIVSACLYMHKTHHVVHRDLKPENFLFETKKSIEANCLKLIDFGLSKACPPGTFLQSQVGTPFYIAPEIWKGQKYDQAVDVWACGVIVYILLCGQAPFSDALQRDKVISEKVVKGYVDMTTEEWLRMSADAKRLVQRLLCLDVKARYTAQQALDDVWIRERAPNASGTRVSSGIVDNLRTFCAQHRLKKAALHVIASQLDRKHIEGLRSLFETLDSDGDGTLTVEEMKAGIEQAGFADASDDLQQILLEVDSDGSGAIDYTEFLAATLDRKVYMQEDACWAAFRMFDTNGDGKISPEELQQVLGDESVKESLGSNLVKALMSEVDMNNDGFIDFDEFMAMMRSQGMS